MNDPELEELFKDPAHREVVDLLKMSRPAAPPLDPNFRSYLRTKLMTEARRSLQPGASRRGFWFNLNPRALAPAMAAVAAGFLVVLGIQIYLQNQPQSSMVAVDLTRIQNKTNVATAEPIVIPFSGPVDKNAVAYTVVLEPATSVRTQWVGQNLVIIPDHPLAPNTTYTVSLKASATPPPSKPTIAATPTVAPSPVIVHFTTVRAPIAPVVPPSYRSANVSYGQESRLADAGTIFNASWTPLGQLLVTRPAGQPGPGSSPSPSATASVSGPPAPRATTDIWLMSSLGTPIRLVVPGGSFPAAAPSGGLFAAWQVTSSNQAALGIWDLQGNMQATITTLDRPDRAPVWIGNDRIAYVTTQGRLLIVDTHGAQVTTPPTRMQHGSLQASPLGSLLAVESVDGSAVMDVAAVASVSPTPLPEGATSFAWSAKGDLAFVVPQPSGSYLYIAAGGRNAQRIASSPSGQMWSDLNWAPDATSLLLASKPAGASSSASRLVLINADGTGLRDVASRQEDSSPEWSSRGDLVLFTRQDEAGGRAFWTASTTPSDVDAAEKQALAEVDKFMQARLQGDSGAAQDSLDANGQSAYQGGLSSLLSPAGSKFDRYYPVTVQQTGSNPNKFLVGVRIFVSRSGIQRSFFEEQLTLVLKDQRYLIDAVTSTPAVPLGHGPTVVLVEVVPTSPGNQVRVRFDADVRPETVTTDTIQVKDADGKMVRSQITFDPDNHMATLTLTLQPGSTYQLVVTTGVTDINGVTMAEAYHTSLVISR
jgi:dipeptidyl aminopeptidase/acylaminoacyl peptidase